MLQVLFPQPYQIEVSKLRQQLEEAHLAWVKAWKQRQAEFKLENIRFRHDPLWKKRIFSIQAAHDGANFFWGAVRVLVAWDIFGPLGLAAAVSARPSAPKSQPRAARWREPG